jgi:ligand-binding SRPBCC domain-containing protein
LIELNETVTWRAKHFGIYQKLTVKITEFNSPNYFNDVMLKGAFKSMKHTHFFEKKGNQTLMRDEFEFEAPLGLLGRIAENLFLKTYLRQFLEERNKLIKSVAESDEWRNFLQD